jgi:alcohol dehydrogenase class IV
MKKLFPSSFYLPCITRIGHGSVSELVNIARSYGQKGVIVHGQSITKSGILKSLKEQTKDVIIHMWEYPHREPTLEDVSQLVWFLRRTEAMWVAGIGGGSVLDLTKAAGGLVEHEGALVDYHDGHRQITKKGIPIIAVPTTAGTGAEATPVVVLINEKTCVKKSIRHHVFMPVYVILDASLLCTCPASVIAYSGMDALTQAIESYISKLATNVSEFFSLEALRLINGAIEEVFTDPCSRKSEDLLVGSYMTGIALTMARLGIVHGLAHPLGSYCRLPHGMACAICLPFAIELNMQVISSKYKKMSEVIGDDLLIRINYFLEKFKIPKTIPSLNQFSEWDKIIEETLASGSTAANPLPVTSNEVKQLLKKIAGG